MATQPLARYGATYGRARERLDHRQLHHLGGHDLIAPTHLVIRHLLAVTLVEPALRAHRQRLVGLFRRARWSLRRLHARIASFGGGR